MWFVVYFTDLSLNSQKSVILYECLVIILRNTACFYKIITQKHIWYLRAIFCTKSTIYRSEINFKNLVCKLHVMFCDIVKLAHEIETSIHYQVTCTFL